MNFKPTGDLGKLLSRRMLPVAIGAPLLLGVLRVYGQNSGWYSHDVGIDLFVVLTIAVLSVLILGNARALGKMDRKLQAQTQFMRSILTSIGDGIIVTDENDLPSMFNAAAEKMLNLSLHRRDPDLWKTETQLVMADGEGRFGNENLTIEDLLRGFRQAEVDYRLGSPPASLRYLNVTSRPVNDREGHLIGTVAVLRDITSLRTELNQAHSQIEQMQKLDAIGRLAGGMAHDFNNILGAIQMYCDLIQRKVGETQIVQDAVSQVEKATQRGAALTRQLLIFSRKKATETQSVQINELLTDHLKMMGRMLGENVDIELHMDKTLPRISANPSQIEQVVMNLLINARDAMPAGGKIVIRTETSDLDEAFASTHLAVKSGRHVLLSVTDTGSGMDAQTKARIFEPFFTTKPVGKGTGMGLSLVYGIVKSLGGTIWVYSELGHGTAFKLYFPSTEASVQQADNLPAIDQLEGSETVLVVEDDSDLRELYGEALMRYGYTVVLAENGREAMQILADQGGAIRLVVTDMVMPNMGGGHLVREASKSLPHLHFICISGYPGESSGYEQLTGTRAEYLEKPFNTQALVAKIREMLDTGHAAAAAGE